MSSLRIALAQVDAHTGNLADNASIVREYTADAAAQQADVVVFPEMVLPGYPVEDLALRGSFQRAVRERLEQLAGELAEDGHGEVAVVVGTLGTATGGKPTNAAAVLHRGRVTLEYAKHHLPTYGVFDEYRLFAAGTAPGVLELGGRRLGLAVCEDIWREGGPVAGYRELDALLVLNASPFEQGKRAARERLAAARAAELGAPLVYTNLVGGQDDLVFDGSSFVTDATGAVVAAAPSFVEHLLVVDLDDGGTVRAVDNAPAATEPDDIGEVYAALVLGLGDYVRKNGFEKVVLGLSGGVDSALVAAVAADAVGPQNVVAVSMPSGYSTQHSRDDAAEQARTLGLDLRVQPVAPMVDAFQGELHLTGVAEENLQARVRGVVLMAISNAEGPLVLATGNKSELAVGYSTIYGDAVGGFAPLKDVTKTRVWELCHWRNALSEAADEPPAIPWQVVTKAPSAELRPGQQDSDSLPDYTVLDPLLDALVEGALGRAELLAEGFPDEDVDLVLGLVDRAEWKRRQYPVGPKVTALAFGRDRQLPITSGWGER